MIPVNGGIPIGFTIAEHEDGHTAVISADESRAVLVVEFSHGGVDQHSFFCFSRHYNRYGSESQPTEHFDQVGMVSDFDDAERWLRGESVRMAIVGRAH